MQKLGRFILGCLLVVTSSGALGQALLLDARADEPVMQFLEELNNLRLTNTAYLTQPVTRQSAAELLFSIDESTLNTRQQKELQFYKLAFSKDLSNSADRPQPLVPISNPFLGLERFKQPDMLYLNAGENNITINPILTGAYHSNQNGVNLQRRVGGDFQANIGRIGLYGSVRETYELRALNFDSLATPKEGGLYKGNQDGGGDFSETRGGITYGFKGGYVGIVRDYVRWGYGTFGTNILDIHTVPFAHLRLHLNPTPWFKFDYFHGSLQSDVVDSSSIANVNGVNTFDFHNKYMAANMISFRPWKPLWISVGNSIIYSKRAPEPTFLIPVMFYKSADHYLNSRQNNAGGNAQMFAAFSLRPGKGLHVYSTIYVDEISLLRALDPQAHSNWISAKSGIAWSNPLPNTTFILEHFRSNAMVYKHYIQTTDYTNAGYNMGHYLRDNAREIIVAVRYRPVYWLGIEGSYSLAQKGPDIADDRVTRNPETGELVIRGIQFLEEEIWVQSVYRLRVAAQPFYRVNITAQVAKYQRPVENASYQHPYFNGNGYTWTFGMGIGF